MIKKASKITNYIESKVFSIWIKLGKNIKHNKLIPNFNRLMHRVNSLMINNSHLALTLFKQIKSKLNKIYPTVQNLIAAKIHPINGRNHQSS